MPTETLEPVAKPRIIVELMPDGTYAIEQYLNGSRRRTLCADFYDIRNALAEQRAFDESAAERKAQRKAEEERALHRKIWYQTAAAHGEGFANRTINGGAKGPNGTAAPAKPKATTVTADLL